MGVSFSHAAGQGQGAAAPSLPHDPKGEQTEDAQAFCFPLSVQNSINYMRCSTLSYQIDFVLDGFAQQ